MEEFPESSHKLFELFQLLHAAGFHVNKEASIGNTAMVSATSGDCMDMAPDFGTHRHVDASRLEQVLSKLQLKSLLYSPLGNIRVSFPNNRPIFEEVMFRRFGACGRKRFEQSQFELMLRSLTCQWTVYGHRYLNFEETIQPCPVYCAVLDKSTGKYMISGADDSLIKVWHLQSGKLVSTLRCHTSEVCDLSFSPGGLFLASLCSEDFSVVLWKRVGEVEFLLHHRFAEFDPVDVTKRSTPLYMSFVGETDINFKLIIAYSNGLVVVHEILNEKISAWNRIVQKPGSELKAFALQNIDEKIGIIVGLGRRVLTYTIPARGDPLGKEYEFPSHTRSPVSHVAPSSTGPAFVASDDDPSSLVLYCGGTPKNLLTGLMSGDAMLVDGSSLLTRLASWGVVDSDCVARVTVDITAWTKDDAFILSSITVKLKHSEDPSWFCVLVFSPISGMLLGAVAQHADSIYNIIPIKASYFATAGHDGFFGIYKLIFKNSKLVTEFQTGFNLNFANPHSNLPRSILDCQISEELDVVISDSRGCVSFLSTKVQQPVTHNEGFFASDYLPIGDSGARTTMAGHDARAVTASMHPLTASGNPILGGSSSVVKLSGYDKRFTTGSDQILIQDITETVSLILEVPRTNKAPDRAERLRNLAAQRVASQSEGEYVRTASGRIVRAHRPMHEDEFDLYENSEIDDETFDDEDDDDDDDEEVERVGTRRSARNLGRSSERRNRESSDEARGSRRNPDAESREARQRQRDERREQEPYSVPTRLEIHKYSPNISQTCCLCGEGNSFLGPFLIADLPDCYFHESCLFTLTSLVVLIRHKTISLPLTFQNLDSLVHQAKQARCSHCRKPGAGIKCAQCRSVFHYPCALIVASICGRDLNPIRDRTYICSRCVPEDRGIEIFSRKKNWRKKDSVRDWILQSTPNSIVYVPQIGDVVCYYVPIGVGDEDGEISEMDNFFSLADLSTCTWRKDSSPIVGTIVDIQYLFPSFYDPERYAIIQRVCIDVGDNQSVWIHYRPKTNGSDCLILKARLDAVLALPSYAVGDTVIVPVDGGDAISAQVASLRPVPHRPGWECLKLQDEDGEDFTVSLWELDIGHNDPVHLSIDKTAFLISWIARIAVGDAIATSRRPRINIPVGSNIFSTPPWESVGAELYLELIEYPVYLNLVSERLGNNYYRSIASLKKDIELLTLNCARFNDPDSLLVEQSRILVAALFTLIDLSVDDQPLCPAPPMPSLVVNRPSQSSRLTSIRATGRDLALVCDSCHASRKVSRDTYDNFIGKRVKCHSIGYLCEREDSYQMSRRVPRSSRTPVTHYEEISEVSSSESPRRSKRSRRY